jgi:hypothetical protein
LERRAAIARRSFSGRSMVLSWNLLARTSRKNAARTIKDLDRLFMISNLSGMWFSILIIMITYPSPPSSLLIHKVCVFSAPADVYTGTPCAIKNMDTDFQTLVMGFRPTAIAQWRIANQNPAQS